MADIQSIYNRLNSGTAFTPLSVDTFGDWSLEAGDVISVSKDGTTYSTPAMQSGLKWNGGSKVAISSLGDKKREPLSVLSRQQYASGGGGRGGYWNARKAFTDIRQSDTQIELIAREQKDIGGKVTNLESSFTVMSDRIGGAISADGKIIASAAIEAVTGPDGKTLLGVFRVKSDQIYLEGNTTLKGMMTVENGNLRVNGGVSAQHYYLGTGFIPVAIDYGIYDLKIVESGGSYTLQKQTYNDGTWKDVGTFSRATSLNGEWSGTYGPYRVVATPQGNIENVYVEFLANGPSGFPIVRPSSSGANLFVIGLDVGSVTGTGSAGKRTVSAMVGQNIAKSQEITDYGDGYTAGRNSVTTIKPTAINVYTTQQGTLLDTRLSASILTAGKFITLKVGSTTYSIQII